MQKIRSLTIEFPDGSTATWTGDGFVQVTSAQEKSEHSGGMARVVGTAVTAHLVIPKIS